MAKGFLDRSHLLGASTSERLKTTSSFHSGVVAPTQELHKTQPSTGERQPLDPKTLTLSDDSCVLSRHSFINSYVIPMKQYVANRQPINKTYSLHTDTVTRLEHCSTSLGIPRSRIVDTAVCLLLALLEGEA